MAMVIVSQVHQIGQKLLKKTWERSVQTLAWVWWQVLSFVFFEFCNEYDWNFSKIYCKIDEDATNDKRRSMNSQKSSKYKLMLIEKGIVLYGGNYNPDFSLWVYIRGDVFCQGMNWQVRNDQLYLVLSIWKDLHLGWVVKLITIDC